MPLNAKLEMFSTETLVHELIERRQVSVARLEAAISLWSDADGAPARAGEVARSAATKVTAKAVKKRAKGKKLAAAKAPKPAAKAANGAKSKKKPARGKRPAEGEKRSLDYALDALRAAGGPLTIRELTDAATAAGWTTSSDDPAKVLGAALYSIAKSKKLVRMKDRGVYELVAG